MGGAGIGGTGVGGTSVGGTGVGGIGVGGMSVLVGGTTVGVLVAVGETEALALMRRDDPVGDGVLVGVSVVRLSARGVCVGMTVRVLDGSEMVISVPVGVGLCRLSLDWKTERNLSTLFDGSGVDDTSRVSAKGVSAPLLPRSSMSISG